MEKLTELIMSSNSNFYTIVLVCIWLLFSKDTVTIEKLLIKKSGNKVVVIWADFVVQP